MNFSIQVCENKSSLEVAFGKISYRLFSCVGSHLAYVYALHSDTYIKRNLAHCFANDQRHNTTYESFESELLVVVIVIKNTDRSYYSSLNSIQS